MAAAIIGLLEDDRMNTGTFLVVAGVFWFVVVCGIAYFIERSNVR